jgi:hypothetical protein
MSFEDAIAYALDQPRAQIETAITRSLRRIGVIEAGPFHATRHSARDPRLTGALLLSPVGF